jgi:DNA polymerase III psi subunit
MLDQMGITVWRLRESQTATPVQTPEPKFVCVAQSAHADLVLLNNILKALQCTDDEANIVWVDKPEYLKNHDWPNAPVIVFGEALYDYAPHDAVRTLSLTALNQDVAAKKALWTQLKAMI